MIGIRRSAKRADRAAPSRACHLAPLASESERRSYHWIGLALIALNIYLHLVLDTIAGGVRWLCPFSEHELVLTQVEARYSPWYLNFVLHWIFAFELLTALAAAILLVRRR